MGTAPGSAWMGWARPTSRAAPCRASASCTTRRCRNYGTPKARFPSILVNEERRGKNMPAGRLRRALYRWPLLLLLACSVPSVTPIGGRSGVNPQVRVNLGLTRRGGAARAAPPKRVAQVPHACYADPGYWEQTYEESAETDVKDWVRDDGLVGVNLCSSHTYSFRSVQVRGVFSGLTLQG